MTTSTSTIQQERRFQWLLQPNLELLTAHDPFLALAISDEFADDTGLEQFSQENRYEVVASPLSPLPFAISYPDTDGNPTRFVDLNPKVAACPMFWLPEELRCPAVFPLQDGSLEMEPIESWQMRVGLELVESGLYDPQTGTWLDVLFTFAGLDITQPDVLERIAAYFAGANDPDLDGIPAKVAEAIAATALAQDDPLWTVPLSLDAEAIAQKNAFVYAMRLRTHLLDGGVELTDDHQPLDTGTITRTVLQVAVLFLSGLDVEIPLSDESRVTFGDYLRQLEAGYDQSPDEDALFTRLDGALAAVIAEGQARFPDDADD